MLLNYVFSILMSSFNTEIMNGFQNSVSLAIAFHPFDNALYGLVTVIFSFLIFIKANKLYEEKYQLKYAIIAAGFLGGSLFSLGHTLNSSNSNLQFYYEFFKNLCYCSALIMAIPFSTVRLTKEYRTNAHMYLVVIGFFCLMALTQIIVGFTEGERLLNFTASEIIYGAIYMLCFFAYFDQRKTNNLKPICVFNIGILLIGLGELYLFSSGYLQSLYRHIVHIEEVAGIILVFIGLKDISFDPLYVSIREKLIIYPTVGLVGAYLIAGYILSSLFNVQIPVEIKLFILTFFIISVIILYFLSKVLTNHLTKLIEAFNNYVFGQPSFNISLKSNDEIGILSQKVNETSNLIVNYTNELLLRQDQIFRLKDQTEALNKIITTLKSTADINEILKITCQEILNTLKPDKVFIGHYNIKSETKKETLSFAEVSASPDFDTVANISEDITQNTWNSLADYFNNTNKELAISDISHSDMPDDFVQAHKKRGIKSILFIPVSQKSDWGGVITIYSINSKREWLQEEIDFIFKIADQLFVAQEQIQLFAQLKKQNMRDEAIRIIIDATRNSLDMDEVLETICNEIINLFNIDRVSITKFKNIDTFKINKEVTSNDSIKKISSTPAYDMRSGVFLNKQVQQNGFMAVNRIEDVQNAPPYFYTSYYLLGVKSLLIVPIQQENDLWGLMTVTKSENYKEWAEDEIELLKTIANQTYIVIRQAELFTRTKKQLEREETLRRITEFIRSSLDTDEVMTAICQEIIKTFNVQRTSITSYPDSKNFTNFVVLKEYVESDKIKRLDFQQIDRRIGEYFGKTVFVEKKNLVINNLNSDPIPEYLRKAYEQIGVKSLIVIPIKRNEENWGVLVLSEYNSIREWQEEEISLLETIAGQVYIALKQAQLFTATKQFADREHLTRNITNALISNLNIEEIKKTLVTELGSIIKADRCALFTYDTHYNYRIKIDTNSEYKSSPQVKSLAGLSAPSVFNNFFFRKLFIDKQEVNFNRREDFIFENKLFNTPESNHLIEYDIQAGFGIPILYRDKVLGAIIIHYNNEKYLSENDLNLIRTISYQAGVLFHQYSMFESTHRQIEKERVIRELISSVSGSFDMRVINRSFVAKIGESLNADRVVILVFDPKEDIFLKPDAYSEYRSSDNVRSLSDLDVADYSFFEKQFKEGQEVLINSIDDFIESNNLKGSMDEYYLIKYNIKGGVGMPIKHGSETLGRLIIHYTHEDFHLDDEDVQYMRILATQLGIAIYQAKLFNNQKLSAEKERMLREILSEIKFSQNLEQVYKYILEKVANVFNLDRTFFIEFQDYIPDKPVLKYEYLRYDRLRKLVQDETISIFHDIFNNTIKELKPFAINDIREYSQYNYSSKDFFEKNKIESIILAPLVRYNRNTRILGIIGVCSSKQRVWSDYEISILESVLESAVTVIWEIMRLTEIDELRNTFILTLAHDFQVPLVGERNALEFIKSRPENQPIGNYKEFLQETINSNKELSSMLTRLLEIYNYESERKELYIAEYDVLQLLNETLDNLNAKIQQKRMNINIRVQPGLSPILADRNEVKKVIHTLVDNSITYTQAGGEISIEARGLDDFANICISDNGPGLPVDIHDRIFKRYEMALAIERKIGSGLGLYLAKLIVEKHLGQIYYTSEPGQGTTFCFTMPIAPNNAVK